MSVTGPHINRYGGGLCYAMCQETFTFYNPSINMCWKGCDFATGRVNDPEQRIEAENMCKRYTSEVMVTERGELDGIKDLRVHANMFPNTPIEIYKACLSGIRRQKY